MQIYDGIQFRRKKEDGYICGQGIFVQPLIGSFIELLMPLHLSLFKLDLEIVFSLRILGIRWRIPISHFTFSRESIDRGIISLSSEGIEFVASLIITEVH